MNDERKDWCDKSLFGKSLFDTIFLSKLYFHFKSFLWQSQVVGRPLLYVLEIKTAIYFLLEEYSCR